MFPLSDDNPHFLAPITTCVLITLNVLAWIFVQRLGSESGLGASICALGLVPGELLRTLAPGTRLEIVPGTYCVLSASPNWFTPVTHMFLHGGWLHLIGNMVFLWVFGDNVEAVMGHFGYLIFYLAGGLAATAAHIFFNLGSSVPSVGASGAISAALGAYIVMFPRSQVRTLIFLGLWTTVTRISAVFFLGIWFAIQLFSGITSISNTAQSGGVAVWAHIGGFAFGVVLGFLFKGKASRLNFGGPQAY